MDNKHIFTVLKEEVKLDSRRTCYPDNLLDGLDFIKTAGVKLRDSVETSHLTNKAGRVRADAVSLIVQTIRFLRLLT